MSGAAEPRTEDDDASADAARWGFTLHPSWSRHEPEEHDGLWARHLPAWLAFLAVSTQWRMAAGMTGAVYLGLDYTAVKAGLDLAGIEVTPEVWRDLRDIEDGARAALNGRQP